MEKIDLNEYLASNEYPGRGIAVAKAPDGRQMFIGYFIMGRSENSRNRVFDPVPERGGICTMAADPAKLEDPSLIIYNPVLTLGRPAQRCGCAVHRQSSCPGSSGHRWYRSGRRWSRCGYGPASAPGYR